MASQDQHSQHSPENAPAEHARYRRRSASTRPLLVVGVLVAIVGVAWVIWAGVHAATRDSGVIPVGYQVVDDSHVQVRYQVQLSRSQATVCTLQAQNSDQTVVGQVNVRLPARPQGDLTESRRDTVRTTQRAATATVTSCQRQ